MTNSALDALKNKTADNAEPSEGWQVFNCAKQATTLVTPAGKRITFTGGRCLTKDADVIAYLDEVIASGVNSITKGDTISDEEAIDPDIRLRLKIREEEKAKLMKTLDYSTDMGSTQQTGKSAKMATSADTAS